MRRRLLVQDTNGKSYNVNWWINLISVGLAVAIALGISALMVGIFYNPATSVVPTTTTSGTTTSSPTFPPLENFTCQDVSSCINGTNLTLTDLVVTGDFVCDNCTVPLPGGYISTVNVIGPLLPTRDFTIVGGPGIAVAGGMHSLTISNSINITITGSVFIVRNIFGNLTIQILPQLANRVFAGPFSGGPGTPAFRPLVRQDIPLLFLNSTSLTGILPVNMGGTGTGVALLPGQLFTGDGMGNLIPVYLKEGYDIIITNYPNGTIEIANVPSVHFVDLSVPTDIFNVTSSPITQMGTLVFETLDQSGNQVWVSPANGSAGKPTFRSLVANDLPLISLSTMVTGILPIANGGTNSSAPLANNRLMISQAGSIVEASALLDGQLFIGFTGSAPVPNVPVGSGGITVIPAPGTLDIKMTSTPSFSTLNVAGTTTLGNYTTCASPMQPSCLDISSQSCPGGVLSVNCIPTSGLYFTSLTVETLTVLNVTNQANVSMFNGTSASIQELYVNNLHLNASMTCIGNASISQSCFDISGKTCPGGVLSESCIPNSLILSNLQVTNNLTVNGMHCFAPIDDACVNQRFRSINGLFANTSTFDFTISALDASIAIQPAGLNGISISATILTLNQLAHAFLAGPIGGPSGPPTWRPIDLSDLPTLAANEIYIGNSTAMFNVSLSLPSSVFQTTVPSISNGGTLTAVLQSQPGNSVFAAPSGITGIPTFRNLTLADLPPMITSVDLTVPSSEFTISSNPLVAPGGTLVIGKAVQNGNTFWAGAANGTNGAQPTFRTLVYKDFDSLNLTLGQFIGGVASGSPIATDLLAGSGIILTKVDGAVTVSASINASNIGTVTSVGLDLPASVFSISMSPVTVSGTLTGAFVSQSVNTIFAAPNGTVGIPSFRSLVLQDMPNLLANQIYVGEPTSNMTSIATLTGGNAITIVTSGGFTTVSSTVSVSLTLPVSLFSVTGSPVTNVGTLAATLISQAARTFFAAPALSSGTPTFRTIALTDLPALGSGQLYIGSMGFPVASSLSAGTGITITPGPGTITVTATFTGTVTSVDLNMPSSVFSTSGGPVTSSGTLTASFISQLANTVFAGPAGAAGTPTFRALVAADIPNLDTSKLTTGTLPIARGGTNSATALSNNRVMISSGGSIVEAAALTNGQTFIGSTGAAPVAGTISAGNAGITIGTGPGTLSVTNAMSVALTLPSFLTVSGSPLTAAGGTITATLASQTANTVFAAPAGAAGSPAFRLLVAADIPNLDTSKLTTGTLPIARGGTNSATALSNNRIMVSSGGAIVEAAALTNGQILMGSTGTAPVGAAITGTTNQVTVTNGAGSITLSTPQNIHTAATPTFASETLTALTNQLTLGTTNTATISATAPAASRTYTIADPGANANFVMDTASALTITNAGTVGQVLTKVAATTATWQATSFVAITNQEVSSLTTISGFSGGSYTVATGMTFVLPSGTWIVSFSTTISPSTSSGLFNVQLFNGVTGIAHSIRRSTGSSGNFVVHTQAILTSDGVNAISLQWTKSSGSGSADMNERSMNAIKLS